MIGDIITGAIVGVVLGMILGNCAKGCTVDAYNRLIYKFLESKGWKETLNWTDNKKYWDLNGQRTGLETTEAMLVEIGRGND